MGLRDSLVKASPTAPTTSIPTPLNDFDQYPVANYNFSIVIDSVTVALFQKVSGINVTREIDSLTEGGFNEYTYEFPGNMSYDHVTFEAGLTSNKFFYEWMMAGKESGGWAEGKSFSLIQRFPDPAETSITWNFDGAFPVKWKISDLNVGNSKAIVIETLELSFNYFEIT